MSTSWTAAPKAVSPLIKTGRWVALVAGIVWGHYRFKYLAKKEIPYQAEQARLLAIQNDKKLEQKWTNYMDEMNKFASEIGVPDRLNQQDKEKSGF